MTVPVRLVLLLAAMALSGVGGARAFGQDDTSAIVVADPRISESSALALSPDDRGLLYTVNDSGHDPLVYVIERATGSVVGTTLLQGVDGEESDPEALTVDPAGTLWVGDVGDNARSRDDIALLALAAPGPGTAEVAPRRFPLSLPGGPADAEALLTAPGSGRMWLVTKGVVGASLLEVPQPLRQDTDNRLAAVSDVQIPLLVTDGTVLPDGSAAVLRTYDQAYVYRLPEWELVGDFVLPRQELGESLTALPGGMFLLAGSEGTPARIARVELPAGILARLSPDDTANPPSPTDDEPSGWWLIGIGGTVAALAAGVVAVAVRRRQAGRSTTHSMQAVSAPTSVGSTAGNMPIRNWLRPSLR